MNRRELITGAAIGTALAGCGLLPAVARGAREMAAFEASSFAEALLALGGTPKASDGVALTLPRQIEDGRSVPVKVSSTLSGVTDLYILAESNPVPIAIGCAIAAATTPALATRIKLAQSGAVHGVVRANDRLFWVTREAQVLRGGCA